MRNSILAIIGSAIFLALACLAFIPATNQIILQGNILIINLHVILDLAIVLVFLAGAVACGITALSVAK